MEQWHLIYTKPGKETLVYAQFEHRGLDAYLPTLQFDRGYGRGIRVEPFFPHYLFIHINLAAQEATDLRWMPGVRAIVSFGSEPAVVPDGVIDTLQARLEPLEQKVIKKAEWLFKAGQEVRIVKGPLAGIQAVFHRGLGGGERVEILLNFLQGLNRATMDLDYIEAIPSS